MIDSSDDLSHLRGGSGFDVAIVDDTKGVTLDLGVSEVEAALGGAGQDVFKTSGSGSVIMAGRGGNDTLTGGANADVLDGGDGNDSIDGGAGNDRCSGDAGNDRLYGGTGEDTLLGGAGTDQMAGGSGDDIYYVDESTDSIIEMNSEGTDEVRSTATFTLSENVENLTLLGYDSIDGSGNTLPNKLIGNDSNNLLDGKTGADTMIGGAGDDTYIVDCITQVTVLKPVYRPGMATITSVRTSTIPGDLFVEDENSGNDTVQSPISYSLGDNLENLVLTSTASVTGTGNSLDNSLTGNSANNSLNAGAGNDTLNGGAGVDTLIGGTGDDLYIVDSTTDTITELIGEGSDTVRSSVTYTLGSNLDNIELNGTGAIVGTGNALANRMTGNAANNSLYGGSGNDTLDGGAGTDTLSGGSGDDTFFVDSTTDTLTELAGEGTDAVKCSVSYTLATNFEKLTLTGSSSVDGTGNSAVNVITGNVAANILDGRAGADSLVGGLGDDTYVVDNASDTLTELAGEGTDTVKSSVTYALGVNLENLTLTGSTAINGTGNALANVLTGNAASNSLSGGSGNDTLDGGAGTDTLSGGSGDDTFFFDSTTDTLTELADEGTDTVRSSVTYSLGVNLENLTLTGSTAINGTGNALANVLTGNAANNSLSGGSGNDTLDGGAGTDTLSGGSGDDTFFIDSTTDTLTELAGEGTDTVKSSVTYSLGVTVENLTPTGSTTINGTGNALANVLTGNAANNSLSGGSGNDTLDGGAGTDTLSGGSGDDIFLVDSTTDTLTELAGEGTDTVKSSASYTLAINFENLTLTGSSSVDGTGNSAVNVIIGNAAANNLDGRAGADSLIGGLGDDTYVIDNASDTLTELAGEGNDTVKSSVTYALGVNLENLTLTGNTAINGTGNALANVLTGNAAANILDGGAGADTMIGGAGNDTYFVDCAPYRKYPFGGWLGKLFSTYVPGDSIVEVVDSGVDTVNSSINYTLGDNLDNLTLLGVSALQGTGNSLSNLISGNYGNNILRGEAGNDTLDGGSGIDSLNGGTGDDTYIIDSTTDTITELTGEGTDTVRSSVTDALGSNLENLELTGAAAIDGTGNALANRMTGNAANNSLSGGSGNDTLDGGTGTDILSGGSGDDTFLVDSTTDTLTELAGEGTDTVNSSVTYTLGVNLENLTLTGSFAIIGTGNALANVLTGNAANNSLSGGSGNDTLDGGAGTDTLSGGSGDDTYFVDSTTDTLTELSGEGTDTVKSSVTYSLGVNLENLTLTGSYAINGTGNACGNVLTGNAAMNSLSAGAGNDTLSGGAGNDTLTGGIGADRFVFSSAPASSGNLDTLTDFNIDQGDRLALDDVVFARLAGDLDLTDNFQFAGSSAIGGNDWIVCDKSTGTLSYDISGNGTAALLPFAILSNKPSALSGQHLAVI
ncbi:beta strand repeat-containing protein [Leptothrix discophora]|uniref:Calcium-binding protein n=1 Tax=Leptothrix discophora TaxID=89 RepID=A0ABT9G245_LEPDI|nr:calcium-binding protein [Leptothrix discophora]MDP4300556.1 calcium-binding protein [Leptothrix discophora]